MNTTVNRQAFNPNSTASIFKQIVFSRCTTNTYPKQIEVMEFGPNCHSCWCCCFALKTAASLASVAAANCVKNWRVCEAASHAARRLTARTDAVNNSQSVSLSGYFSHSALSRSVLFRTCSNSHGKYACRVQMRLDGREYGMGTDGTAECVYRCGTVIN